MSRIVSYVAVLLLAVSVNAQKQANPSVFAKTITPSTLKTHLTIIASAEMEGRDTPSPGLEKAARYIESQFAKAGLQPGNGNSFRQTYNLYKDSVRSLVLRINSTSFTPYTDFSAGISLPQNVNLQFSSFVFVGYGIVDATRNDYGTTDVKDKLIIFLNGAPDGYNPPQKGRLSPSYINNKIKIAKEKGAAAVCVIVDELPTRYNKNISYTPAEEEENSKDIMPVFNISETVARQTSGQSIAAIKAAVNYGNIVLPVVTQADVVMQYELIKSVAPVSNVLGVVEGSDKKDEYLFITAHYDHLGTDQEGHIYYGADDDGSGTVSVVAMAEAFAKAKKAGKGPRRTVVFMTVSGEEKGLWGSEYYAAHPVYPLSKTTANLNIDMIGRIGDDYLTSKDANNYIYVVGDDKLSSDLTPITEKVNRQYTKLKLDRKFNSADDPERIYYRSDHYNFARNGVPAIFYFNGLHADYHQLTDTVDKINFPLLAKRAQLVFYTAWEMANRDKLLTRDIPLPQ